MGNPVAEERPETTTDGLGETSGAISSADPVERALAAAIAKASEAGDWSVVAQLAVELKARREAREQVVDLTAERKRREGGDR